MTNVRIIRTLFLMCHLLFKVAAAVKKIHRHKIERPVKDGFGSTLNAPMPIQLNIFYPISNIQTEVYNW